MQWLNYHHLYYFKVIATEGGIAKASQKLRLGQPTLSAQLRLLENSLGKPLFERRNRRLVLSDTGQAALNYANEIFRLGNEMVEVVQDRSIGNQTHVQIGALDSVPKGVVLSLVLRALKIGQCTVSILEGKGNELLRELLAHRIDLLVSNYPQPALERARVYSRSVARVPVLIYGSKSFRGLRRNFPSSLAGKPFVLPTLHSKLRHDIDHFFKVRNIHISRVAETQDTSLLKLLCMRGVGLAPVSTPAAFDSVRRDRPVEIGRLPGVYEEVWLVAAERRIENPVASELMRTFAIAKSQRR